MTRKRKARAEELAESTALSVDGEDLDAEVIAALYAAAAGFWTPPERLTMSEWAEKYYLLESGRLRLIPFQKGFMDAFTDPSVEEISWKKSARVGATMTMVVAVVYYAAQDPMHLMLLEPTDDDAKGISVDHITPAYERCDQTKALFEGDAATRNTQTHKVFPGGSLKIKSAKSPRNLRRHDVDVLLMDEVDGYETTVEGNAPELAKRRTQNSNRRKIVAASTPVNAETSYISKAFADSDQRHYYVPCKKCGSHQTLSWEYMCIDGKRVTQMHLKELKVDGDWIATMQCRECGEQMSEQDKGWMLENGEWRATAPFRGHAGFHINTLYSPFPNASWQKLVLEYLRAKRSPDTLQTFVNTVLGMEWSDNLDNLDEEIVSKRVRDGDLSMVPDDILMITLGIDVQKDRIEATYLGHGPETTHVLAHKKVYGDPTGDALWEKVDAMTLEKFPHALGGQIGISATAVDSGNWTHEVYRFCAQKQHRGVYAIKGTPGPRPIWAESKIRPGEGAKLYNVGTDAAKTTVMQRLTVGDKESPGYVSFCHGFDIEYFEQLLSEYRKVEYVSGRPKFKWERKEGRRAEALDCFVYALAAFVTEAPNWELLRQSLIKIEQVADDKGFGSLGAMMANL